MTYGDVELKQICKAHGQCFDSVLRRFVQARIPLSRVHHLFDAGSDDEMVIGPGRKGYRMEVEITAEGRVDVRAIPGHLAATFHGYKWVDDPRDALMTDEERERGEEARRLMN